MQNSQATFFDENHPLTIREGCFYCSDYEIEGSSHLLRKNHSTASQDPISTTREKK